jgi:hypothetical protein
MIPRTFPSIIEAFQTKMVVYVLPSVSGLKAWIDYIPVKGVVTEDPVLANTYANNGYQVVKSLESISGLQAWIGYIPVFEDASFNKPWSTDAGGYIPVGGLFSPASFFANGEQGWWFDPSNFATLFQDSAGTTPVTAMEQPVGLQLDLSKGLVLGPELVVNGGPDFTSSTSWSLLNDTTVNIVSGDFEIVRGSGTGQIAQSFVTVVGKTYKISATVRRGTAATFSVSAGNGESGASIYTSGSRTDTAYTDIVAYFAAASTTTWVRIGIGGSVVGSTILADNISVKELPGNHRFQTTSANRPVVSARVNLFVGTATLATQSVTTRATTHTLTFTGAGSITLLGTAIGVYTAGTHSVTTTAGTLTATVLGTVTQADLRETNVGVGLPAYQAVVTSTNYDSTGFPVYIKPNGSNQFMQTNSINFTATDKMTVWQGVRKLRDTAQSMIAELSASIAANNGTFLLTAPNSAAANYNFASKGTTQVDNIVTTYTSPITNVLVGIGDISGSINSVKVNGGAATTVTSSQGTGNYGTYPAYFYARAGTSLYFNGNDYGSIARGAESTAEQITNGEAYINSKTKAF